MSPEELRRRNAMSWQTSVLVVANVTAGSDELLEALAARAKHGPAAFTLVVPAPGGVEARASARARLEGALERMRGAGLEVDGRLGDPDPLVAVKEGWDPAAFDEIVVCTLPTGASRWLLVDLPHRVERLTGAPVTHVVAREPRPPAPTVPAPEHETLGVLSPLLPLGWGHDREEAR
jgi:hypothetical protein